MTEKEARNLAQTDPFPKTLKGKRKVHEHVYHSLCGFRTKEEARDRMRLAMWHRKNKEGYYCPGGKHKGVYKKKGKWYAYLHFARYV